MHVYYNSVFLSEVLIKSKGDEKLILVALLGKHSLPHVAHACRGVKRQIDFFQFSTVKGFDSFELTEPGALPVGSDFLFGQTIPESIVILNETFWKIFLNGAMINALTHYCLLCGPPAHF